MWSPILVLNVFFVFFVHINKCTCDPVLGVLDLRAANGRDAKLPCGLGDPLSEGTAVTVSWFKDNKYVYSYDLINPIQRTPDKKHVVPRPCKGADCPNESALPLKAVTTEDAGFYRCRLFFDNVSTGEYCVNLTVVESTEAPTIFNLNKQERVKLGFVGPFLLGTNVTLVCAVVPVGNTTTQLYWMRNGEKILFSKGPVNGVMQVDLQLKNITRAEMNVLYQCAAQNSDVSAPLVTSAKLKMITPPLSVELRMANNFNLEVDNPRVVDCVVIGCMPPPQFNWIIAGVETKPGMFTIYRDGNFSISSLTVLPSRNQNNKELICMVRNPQITGKTYEAKHTIKVGFRPVCRSQTIKIGAVTKEVETVACIVEADPAPEKILWTFADSKTMWSAIEKVPGKQNLYYANLTWLSRMDDIGPLICQASNLYGNQTVPCTFNISAGGVPEVPDCDVQHSRNDSLRVRCIKGWDGGRPQIIHLDIVAQDGKQLKNLTDAEGMFYLPKVGYHGNISAIIYASNKRGRSKKKSTFFIRGNLSIDVKAAFIPYPWVPYFRAFSCLFVAVLALGVLTACFKTMLATRGSDTESDSDNSPDGIFRRERDFHREYREPDYIRESEFVRQQRLLELECAHLTMAHVEMCEDLYSPVPTPPPPPACRVVYDDIPSPTPGRSKPQIYYV